MDRIKKWLIDFRKKEEGSATIEAVLWFPMFIFILVMVTDVSFVFHRQSQLYRVVQDANRAFSVGSLTSPAATQTYIKNVFEDISPNMTATTIVNNRIITTTVNVPVDDLVAIGYFDFLSGYNLTVQADQFQEY